jgi:hypothetical protein
VVFAPTPTAGIGSWWDGTVASSPLAAFDTFAFTPPPRQDAVLVDARELRDSLGFTSDNGWTVFVARGLVEEPWDDPAEVIPAWVVEGRVGPVDVAGRSE